MPTAAAFVTVDLPALVLAVCACLACGLTGNFLVLRRQALVGDAMSHVVLPGIVIAWLVAGTIDSLAMMAGGLLAALLATGLIAAVRHLARLEAGAAMGVVFTAMFAIGVVLIERSPARDVHLDTTHALMGALELALWLGPTGWGDVLAAKNLAALPREVTTLAAVALATAALTAIFFKELRLATFDAGLATVLGYRPRLVGGAVMAWTAIVAVAAFDAVGSILPIAMFICPAATARMLTDRLGRQIWASAAIAVLAAAGGYFAAAFAPLWTGGTASLNAAGMIAVVAGALQVAAMLFAPRHGALARALARRGPVTTAA